MNIENLRRMAEHITTIPQEKFHMLFFRRVDEVNNHECNSVGCVIGHCVILDDWNNIPKKQTGEIDFWSWSEKFTEMKPNSDEWCWCFSYVWHGVDNTPIGASKRIMWLIENGLPKDFCKQITDRAELCYL